MHLQDFPLPNYSYQTNCKTCSETKGRKLFLSRHIWVGIKLIKAGIIFAENLAVNLLNQPWRRLKFYIHAALKRGSALPRHRSQFASPFAVTGSDKYLRTCGFKNAHVFSQNCSGLIPNLDPTRTAAQPCEWKKRTLIPRCQHVHRGRFIKGPPVMAAVTPRLVFMPPGNHSCYYYKIIAQLNFIDTEIYRRLHSFVLLA